MACTLITALQLAIPVKSRRLCCRQHPLGTKVSKQGRARQGDRLAERTWPCSMAAFEFSVLECPKKHLREVVEVFPGADTEGLLVIPTFQRSQNDLVKMGEVIETEKDLLLERFMEFAKGVCNDLDHKGIWCDYIDPCSGLPMIHKAGMKVYSEVDGAATLLGFSTINAGCCKVMVHPNWGTYVYPASLFARGDKQAVEAALQRALHMVHSSC